MLNDSLGIVLMFFLICFGVIGLVAFSIEAYFGFIEKKIRIKVFKESFRDGSFCRDCSRSYKDVSIKK